MIRKILIAGVVAGLIVGVPMFTMMVADAQPPAGWAMLIGYLTMLIALSTVFAAVKRHRDADLGGVIGFWPALGMGLAISLLATVFYVLAWEAALAVSGVDFAGDYTRALIAQQKAAGVGGAALAEFEAGMARFRAEYADPLQRMVMTSTEILPVGLLVSLVTAGLLRNHRFLPARRV